MVYFVRHGESEANKQGIYAGQRVDSPLTDLGRAQDRTAGQRIKAQKIEIDHIITSPLQRTRDSAAIIAEVIGFNPRLIEIDPRLAEYDMGELSGHAMPKPSIDLTTARSAEDVHEFQRRVIAAVNDAANLSGNTLLVSHAAVGRMIKATSEGHHLPHFYDLKSYPHGEVLKLDPPYKLAV